MTARAARVAVVVAGVALATAAFGAAFPAVLRIPRRNAGPAGLPRARFSHVVHAASAASACYACHPSLFPQAPLAFTHEEMRAGRYCGACHQGRTAFAIEGTACGRCHATP